VTRPMRQPPQPVAPLRTWDPDTETRTTFEAGGGDRICHLLDDAYEPLCGKKVRLGGLLRRSHLVPGAKAKDSPCPACGRPRCEPCAEVACP
jgi:hypothetical protein